jgi:anti-sigma regulatory factor (Ser/Thr protein kinase)
MSRRADAVTRAVSSPRLTAPAEPGSGAGPAPIANRRREPVRYPHQSDLALGAFPSAVPCARAHTAAIMHEWGLGHLAEAAGLVVTEIATNAIKASDGLLEQGYKLPFIHLWLSADSERVTVKVWDASNRLPEQQAPDLESEHGRGLMLVQALTEDYGAFLLEGGNGKVVWAVLKAHHIAQP